MQATCKSEFTLCKPHSHVVPGVEAGADAALAMRTTLTKAGVRILDDAPNATTSDLVRCDKHAIQAWLKPEMPICISKDSNSTTRREFVDCSEQ